MNANPERSGARVAYIMSRFPKLTETFILFEILALEDRGDPVAVYPLLREKTSVTHPQVDRVLGNCRFLPFFSFEIARAHLHYLFTKPGTYLRLIADVLSGTLKSRNFLLGAIGIFPKVVRFAYEMERGGIEHVHSHFATHPALAAFMIHRLTGIPYSFTAHGSDLHVDRTMLADKVAESAFTVTVSNFNREVIVDECGEWARAKIEVVHCGVDTDAFAPRSAEGSAGPLRILCVASFEEVKGHKYLIEACRLLREQGVEVECDLIGEGPLREEVEEQIAAGGLDRIVRVRGGLPRNEVIGLLGKVDTFVLPSVPTAQGKREGIPVALMEAMACNLPVVSSRLSGIPELVEDRVVGILVEPRDAAGLAGALRELHEDAALRRTMGTAGREKVLAEFDLGLNAKRLTELFFDRNVSEAPSPAMQLTR